MKVKVLIATHKEYEMPKGEIYSPIQVGTALSEKLKCVSLYDNLGDNISEKNKNYCELTALYWAWKNLDADYIGLCHYRRYFRGRNGIATENEIANELLKAPIIVPQKRHYIIETNYSQYIHAHHKKDLVQAREIIKEQCPEYLCAWNRVMAGTSGHRFNMLIMRKSELDKYCSWLFRILFELERRLDITNYSEYDSRVFGFVAERLLDVWLEKENMVFSEMKVYATERTSWIKKGIAFVWRKIKYKDDKQK